MKYNGKNLQEVLVAHDNWVRWGVDDGRADFVGANLREANLRGADLCEANLKEANLHGANMYEADLCGADLTEANLRGADLRRAVLRLSNLTGANLRGADLYEADLRGAKGIPFIPMACPDAGAFIGWKKCGLPTPLGIVYDPVVVKLLIPEDAERSSATTRKCRASHAIVLEIQETDGEVLANVQKNPDMVAFAISDPSFEYIPGETVRPREPFDTNRWNECGSGIHFFINRQEAVNYQP